MGVLLTNGIRRSSLPGAISDLVTSQVDSQTLGVTFTGAARATSHQYRAAPRINQQSGTLRTGMWCAPRTLSANQVPGLMAQHPYDVQVRGVNGYGVGPWSNMAADAATATTASTKNGTTTISQPSDSYIAGMVYDNQWTFSGARKVIDFSFPTATSQYTHDTGSYGGGELSTFSALSTTQKNYMRRVLFNIAIECNLEFVEITETDTVHAELRYANTTTNLAGASAFTYLIASDSGDHASGDTWFSASLLANPVNGNFAGFVMHHEPGHGLGLDHASNGNAFTNIPSDRDTMNWTVMSYRVFQGNTPGSGFTLTNEYPQQLGPYDILAYQFLYGVNTFFDGDAEFTFTICPADTFINGVSQGGSAAGRIVRTLWSGGGQTTINLRVNGWDPAEMTLSKSPDSVSIIKPTMLSLIAVGHPSEGNLYMPVRLAGNTAGDVESILYDGGSV